MARRIGPTTFQTKGDAQAWLAEERLLISRREWTSPRERAVQAATAESDRRERRNSLDVNILPAFGKLPLDEITTAAVRQWRGRFSPEGRDAAGARAYGLLKAMLQTAEDDELVLRNPCRLKGAGHTVKQRESVALSPGELSRLAESMPERWRAPTLVSGWCGLRVGEAAGLRRGDVDLDEELLRVAQTARHIGTPEGMVWHDLWHTADTLAADAGATQSTLQARIGHTDPKVSAIYLHTSPGHDANSLKHCPERRHGKTAWRDDLKSCHPDTFTGGLDLRKRGQLPLRIGAGARPTRNRGLTCGWDGRPRGVRHAT